MSSKEPQNVLSAVHATKNGTLLLVLPRRLRDIDGASNESHSSCSEEESNVYDELSSRTDLSHSWHFDNGLGHEGSDLDFSPRWPWRRGGFGRKRSTMPIYQRLEFAVENHLLGGANYDSFEEISPPRSPRGGISHYRVPRDATGLPPLPRRLHRFFRR